MRTRKKTKRTKQKTAAILRLLFFFYFSFAILNCSLAQQPPVIKKSDKIEIFDGKKFYIHSVEKGQTLYSIARTYSTTVDIVLANNQDAVDGLKAGDKIKIPYSGNTDTVKKEIEKQSKEPIKKELSKKETTSIPVRTDSSQKHSHESDLENMTTVPIKGDSSLMLLENIKPIGDIHVALFLPLNLQSAEAIDVNKVAQGDERIEEDTRIAIEFYEGMKLAFDSLRKQGFPGFLHVYDSDLDSASFAKLVQKAELKEMDLIIGPLYGKKFEHILRFAKENKINIVSPTLKGNNMLLGNPNVSKITPSYITQTQILANYVTEKYAGQNIILFNSANPKDKPYLGTFKRTANPILQKTSAADTVKEITFTTLKNFISTTKPNIVVVASTNPSFVTEAVNKLYLHKQETKDSIIVIGLSNFEEIESLDFGYLKTLNAVISSYNFVDYRDPNTKRFILKYRNEFKTDPTEYVFAGFDAGYFYLNGLQKYGNGLQRKLPELKQKGIQTEFNFFQPDANSGYENQGVGIMKFENYSYTRIR